MKHGAQGVTLAGAFKSRSDLCFHREFKKRHKPSASKRLLALTLVQKAVLVTKYPTWGNFHIFLVKVICRYSICKLFKFLVLCRYSICILFVSCRYSICIHLLFADTVRAKENADADCKHFGYHAVHRTLDPIETTVTILLWVWWRQIAKFIASCTLSWARPQYYICLSVVWDESCSWRSSSIAGYDIHATVVRRQ